MEDLLEDVRGAADVGEEAGGADGDGEGVEHELAVAKEVGVGAEDLGAGVSDAAVRREGFAEEEDGGAEGGDAGGGR